MFQECRDSLSVIDVKRGGDLLPPKEFGAMTNILRFVQVFALGAWVGSIFYFSAAVAPGAFRVLSNQDQAGALVQFTLGRLHTLGVVAGLLYLFASIGLAQSFKGLVRPAALGVVLMILLTVTSQNFVMRRMLSLRTEMGSVVATPSSNPLRAEFDRLHGISVKLEGAVLLIGFAALFLTVREKLVISG
jgi:Domain of unknown function (DUF4149)